jgi:hypothetical protein
MKQIKLVFFLLIGFLVSNCTKVNEPKTPSEILQSTTWMVESTQATGYLTGLIYQRGRTAEGSQYDMSKIRVTFYSDGTVSAIDNTGNAQSKGKWSLSENDTKINITSAGNELLNGVGVINALTTTDFTFSGERTYQSQLVKATVRMIPAQ